MVSMKHLQKLFILFAMGISLCSIQACNDDDDKLDGNNDSPLNHVGEFIPGSTQKLLSVGEYTYHYTLDGKIQSVMYDGGKEIFTYSPNEIQIKSEVDTIESDFIMSVTLNDKGYLSETSYSSIGSDENHTWNYIENSTHYYDAEGHLLKMITNWTQDGIDNNEPYTGSGIDSIVYIWENGLMKQTYYEYKWSWGAEDIYEKITSHFNYEEGKNKNQSKQDVLFSDYLSYLGFYGKGPDYLPTSRVRTTISNEDGEVVTESDTLQYSFEFNEDGTVHQKNDIYFTYGTIQEQENIEKPQATTRSEMYQEYNKQFILRAKHRRR